MAARGGRDRGDVGAGRAAALLPLALASTLACAAPAPREIELPSPGAGISFVIGLFSSDELLSAQLLGARPDQLPYWDDTTVDAVEVVTIGATPVELNLLEGPLSLSQPAAAASRVGELLDRVAPRLTVTLHTWTATEAELTRRERAPSGALLDAYLPARVACPPIDRRPRDSTVAVDLTGAQVVESARATILGVEVGSGATRFGYATKNSVQWTSRWPRPALALGRGLGSKAVALVDDGGGQYTLITLDYNGFPVGPRYPLGAFSAPPRLTTARGGLAFVYTPDRVVEVALDFEQVRDVTATWGLRPLAVAVATEAPREPPLLLAMDERTDVFRRAGAEWSREDGLAPLSADRRFTIAASTRRAWANEGERVWQRDFDIQRWRRDDPSTTDPTTHLVLADAERAVALVASRFVFVHNGSTWCPSSGRLEHPHELLAGGEGEVLARARVDGGPLSWGLVWLTP